MSTLSLSKTSTGTLSFTITGLLAILLDTNHCPRATSDCLTSHNEKLTDTKLCRFQASFTFSFHCTCHQFRQVACVSRIDAPFCNLVSQKSLLRTHSLPNSPLTMDANWQQFYWQHYLQQQAQAAHSSPQQTPTGTHDPMTHTAFKHSPTHSAPPAPPPTVPFPKPPIQDSWRTTDTH